MTRTTRISAVAACGIALVSGVGGAGLCAAAVLLHAPVGLLPLLVLVCIACPMLGIRRLRRAITALWSRRASERRAIASLRRALEQLPEVRHPLDG